VADNGVGQARARGIPGDAGKVHMRWGGPIGAYRGRLVLRHWNHPLAEGWPI
jgi:hypothetical protein